MAKIEEESTWLLKKVDRTGEDWMSKGENRAQRQGHCRQLGNWSKGKSEDVTCEHYQTWNVGNTVKKHFHQNK